MPWASDTLAAGGEACHPEVRELAQRVLQGSGSGLASEIPATTRCAGTRVPLGMTLLLSTSPHTVRSLLAQLLDRVGDAIANLQVRSSRFFVVGQAGDEFLGVVACRTGIFHRIVRATGFFR